MVVLQSKSCAIVLISCIIIKIFGKKIKISCFLPQNGYILVIVNNIDHNRVCDAVSYHQVKFQSENVIVIKLGN